jgi:protein ImuB
MADPVSRPQLELLAEAQPAALRAARPRPGLLPPTGPRRAELARELWLAVHLPVVAFEALQDEFTNPGPRAVLETSERLPRVLLADPAARRAGVRPGLSLAAALALSPALETRMRDVARERAWLERAAALVLRFSSRVSLEPPDGLLLEVRGSLRLFGGLEALCGRIEAECRAARMQPAIALAPTPSAALACARAGVPARITSLSQLAGALAPLPLAALRWDEATLERLAAIGVRTIGGVLRLPRAGFAQRFGTERLALLDKLAGRRTETRRGFRAAERFRARFEPDYELEDLDAVLASLWLLLVDLQHFLESRQCGVTVIRCRLSHRGNPPTACTLRLAAPEARAGQFLQLLRERLGTFVLPAPVRRCELRSGPLVPRPLASNALWRPGEHGGDGGGHEDLAFIERLRARLGREGVYSPALRADHRPEAISAVAEPALCGAVPAEMTTAMPAGVPWSAARRPLWLLAEPQLLTESRGQPCGDGVLELVRGPERIETGWWDGAGVERDYYVARDSRGAWLWIFRERAAPHRWFLHGVFG